MSRRNDEQAIAAIKASPEVFRRVLLIDTDKGPRHLDEVLDPWQRQDFEAIDDACRAVVGQPVAPRHLRAWLERPRGHSKTADIAVVVTWLLFASQRMLSGVAAAADQDQARLLRDAISRLTKLNIWLTGVFDVQRDKIVNKQTGSTLTIISADAPSAYGTTPDVVIADEVTHWGDSQEMWTACASSVGKKPTCLFLCIMNAGFLGSWQWKVREEIRQLPGWYFHSLDGPMASWITPETLEEQRRIVISPQAFSRLWENRWGTGAGDALSEDDIQAAVTLPGPLCEPERGWTYVAGVDLGITKDASSLCIVGVDTGYYAEVEQERQKLTPAQRYLGVSVNSLDIADDAASYCGGTGRIKLAAQYLWHPKGNGRGKVDLESVEAAILNEYQRFGLACIGIDPYQAASITERLQKREIPIEPVVFNAVNLKVMAMAMLDSFSQHLIDLYEHSQLLADLRALRIEERNYGVRLTSPRGPNGHGDAATALAIALLIAKRYAFSAPTRINGPLICWP